MDIISQHTNKKKSKFTFDNVNLLWVNNKTKKVVEIDILHFQWLSIHLYEKDFYNNIIMISKNKH